MSIQLFKEGDQMAIQTDCKDEYEFVNEFSELLDELIAKDSYQGDWAFQLMKWLPQLVDVCCAYRGYKSDVDKRTVIIAGDRLVAEAPVHEINSKKNKLREAGAT